MHVKSHIYAVIWHVNGTKQFLTVHNLKQMFKCSCKCYQYTNILFLQYPEVFTLGMFSWAGPEREQLRKQTFRVILTGTGWGKDTVAANPADKRGPPDTVRHCRVSTQSLCNTASHGPRLMENGWTCDSGVTEHDTLHWNYIDGWTILQLSYLLT